MKFGHRGHLFDERDGVLRLLEQASASERTNGGAGRDLWTGAAGLSRNSRPASVEDGIHSILPWIRTSPMVTALRVAAAESRDPRRRDVVERDGDPQTSGPCKQAIRHDRARHSGITGSVICTIRIVSLRLYERFCEEVSMG